MTQDEIIILLSWISAIFIGIVVSLDVSGLLISRYRDQAANDGFARSALRNAFLHAATHAIMFLGYFYVVSIPISWLDWLVQLVSHLKEWFPPISGKEVTQTVFFISSLVIVIFVWITYSQKIVENHGAKLEAENSSLIHARIDIRLLYWFARRLVRNAGWLVNFALALAVAVDMLAITSFIRVFFSISPDAENPEGDTSSGTSNSTHPHFDFGLNAPELEPLLFAFIIFVMVFITAMAAMMASRLLGKDKGKRVLLLLRVLEPFFVFWLMVASIDHMFGLPVVNAAQYAIKVTLGLMVAAILTVLLVSMHGLNAIEQAIQGGIGVTLQDDAQTESSVTDREWTTIEASPQDDAQTESSVTVDNGLARALTTFLISLAVITAILIGLFFITHPPNIEKGKGLAAFLDAAAILAAVITLIALYLPLRWVINAEERVDQYIFGPDAGTGGWPLIASFTAYFIVLAYIHLSYVGADIFALHSGETFIIPLCYFGCIGIATSALAWLRTKRHLIADPPSTGARLSVGEFLTAFAIAISLFQIIIR